MHLDFPLFNKQTSFSYNFRRQCHCKVRNDWSLRFDSSFEVGKLIQVSSFFEDQKSRKQRSISTSCPKCFFFVFFVFFGLSAEGLKFSI